MQEGCNFINAKSKLCQIDRDKDSPMCGKCKTGYSEATPDVCYCLRCTDNSGLTTVILPLIMGMIAMFIKEGMKVPEFVSPACAPDALLNKVAEPIEDAVQQRAKKAQDTLDAHINNQADKLVT